MDLIENKMYFYTMKSLWTLLFFFLLSMNVQGQLDETFQDGDITNNPEWEGDINDFIIEDETLRLFAETEGSTFIYTDVVFPDSMIWDFHFKLDFAPSGSNQLIIGLASADINLQNAYILEVGESGSTDALKFYQLIEGAKMLLGTCTSGTLGNDPASAKVKVIYDKDQFWNIFVDYDQTGNYQEEIIVFDDTFIAANYQYFGVQCKYTSSRVDKFYFEHMVIDSIKQDETAPSIASYEVLDDQTVKIVFTETVEESSAVNLSNYNMVPTVTIEEIQWTSLADNEVMINFSQALSSGVEYTLSVENVQDVNGNSSITEAIMFSLIEFPAFGDIVINEVLFNPIGSGNDFIELYNISNKKIDIKGMILSNVNNGQEDVINTSIILEGGAYIAITDDKNGMIDIYPKGDNERIIKNGIPSLNNDEGNVSLLMQTPEGKFLIDSFNYNEDMHYQLLEDIDGVSLEKINPYGLSNDEDNWHSAAASYNFASPGVKNSVVVQGIEEIENEFEVITNTFSPDADSFEDFMVLQYSLKEVGNIVDINIYNSRGVFVRKLLDHETLASEGIITWDGTDDNRDLLTLGVYILNIEILSLNGEQKHIKKTCILARQL